MLLCKAVPDSARQILATMIRRHEDSRAELEFRYHIANADWADKVVYKQDGDKIEEMMQKYLEMEEESLLCRQKLLLWRVHKMLLEKIHKWLNAANLDDFKIGWEELMLLSKLSTEYMERHWGGLVEAGPMWNSVN